MTSNTEEMIELDFSNSFQNNQIEKYLNFENCIETINHTRPHGDVTLNIATWHGHSEAVQILFTENALKRIPYSLTRYDEMKELFERNFRLFSSDEEYHDNDYIEWSLISSDLIKKRQEFLKQIDLYKTYDNQHHLITKLLIEIIEYYLNEYLFEQEHFSQDNINKLTFYFQKAIEEQSYLTYFIKAYTLTNSFHHVLNKHLALYILDYFDTSYYSLSSTKHRLINCLVHIVTLLINHPDIYKYKYRGIVYRGLSMTDNDLKHYNIGNHILNRSFVSTSKNRSIAQLFTNHNQQNSSKISVLLKYTIKQNQTAIDIEHISTIEDEQEVLILPFSVFQIKDKIENNPNMSPPVLVEIDLEECLDDEQFIDKKFKDRLPTNFRHRTKRRQDVNNFKYFWCSIVILCIIVVLILILLFINNIGKKWNLTSQNEEENTSKVTCPRIHNRYIWKAKNAKNHTILSTPVPYVAIHHTTGEQCNTFDSCILRIQYWQNLHMNERTWDDIGYNFLVGGNGYIFEGRGWNYTGAHCKGFNPKSIGIGVIGDFSSISPPKSSITAINSLINCGISFGFIQTNYTFLGHWGFGVLESYMINLNRSHRSIQYCLSPLTTLVLKQFD